MEEKYYYIILCEVKVQTHVFNSIDLRFYHGLYVLVGIVYFLLRYGQSYYIICHLVVMPDNLR